MAQKTWVAGDVVTAADTNLYLSGEGGAWSTWTPTVTQSGSVTVTNTRSRFARYGRTIHFVTHLTVTGTGTASNSIAISLPVTAASANEAGGGVGYVFDSSAGIYYPGNILISTTATFNMMTTEAAASSPLLGVSGFTAALAVNDVIRAAGTYEAAS